MSSKAPSGEPVKVYLSHPFPHKRTQCDFIESLRRELAARRFVTCTVTVVEGVETSVFGAIRSRVLESHGLVVVALRKTWVRRGVIRGDSENPALPSADMSRLWLTSPYCQIEPAMAYQLALPIMVLREHGVMPEGFLDNTADVLKAPEIDLLEDSRNYFRSELWTLIMDEWETLVRRHFAQSPTIRRGRKPAQCRSGESGALAFAHIRGNQRVRKPRQDDVARFAHD
jgi:hypothetical protein